MTEMLPFVGAAMPSTRLEEFQSWIIENQRDLEIQDFISPVMLEGDDLQPTIAKIKTLLDGYTGRMGVHAPFWNIPLAAWDPKIRSVVQERFKQTLDVCAEIGATHMVIHSPLHFFNHPGSISNPMMGYVSIFDVVHETLEDTVKHAESIGCTLVIENIYDRYPVMLTDLVKSFQSDYVRQSLDAGHAFIMSTEGAPPPDYYVREAGKYLAHIHLQDTDGFSDRHWCVGDGNINWRAIFEEIRKQESNPRLILEISPDHIMRATQYLNNLGLAQ